MARQQVALLYNFLPTPPDDDSGQPSLTVDERQAHIKAAIATLLLKGAFMHNGKDRQVRIASSSSMPADEA